MLKREVWLPGDVDCDGNITINDVTVLIDYLMGGQQELPNDLNADVNQDGNITVQDATTLIDMILRQ